MKFEFHPEALDEYEKAAKFLDRRRPGLGSRFIECIESAIAEILESPDIWRTFDGEVRRCLARVFPYAVLYTIESDHVLIVAVMHCHRDPDYWRDRLPSV